MTCEIGKDTDVERICNTVIGIISKVKNGVVIIEENSYPLTLSKYVHIFHDIDDYLKTELKKEQHRIFMSNIIYTPIIYTPQEDIRSEKEKHRIFEEEIEKIRSFYNSALEPNCSINYEPLIDLVKEILQKRKSFKEKELANSRSDVVDIEINPKDLKIDVFGECTGVRITHIPTCTVVDCMEHPLQYKIKIVP